MFEDKGFWIFMTVTSICIAVASIVDTLAGAK